MSTFPAIYYDADFYHSFNAKGAWHLFSYAHVKEVLDQPDIFGTTLMPPLKDCPLDFNPIWTNVPVPPQLLPFVNEAFRETTDHLGTDWIREYIDYHTISYFKGKPVLLDGEWYYIGEITNGLMRELLGLDRYNRSYLIGSIRHIDFTPSDDMEFTQFIQDRILNIEEDLAEMIRQKKEQPGYDLISCLLKERNGIRLTDQEVMNTTLGILTTRHRLLNNLLINTICAVATLPDLQRTLRADTSLIPAAVAEINRWRSPVRGVYRRVLHDTSIDGFKMMKGQYIIAWIESASRDPAVFEQPQQLILNRPHTQQATELLYSAAYNSISEFHKAVTAATLYAILEGTTNIRLTEDEYAGFSNDPIVNTLQHVSLTYER